MSTKHGYVKKRLLNVFWWHIYWRRERILESCRVHNISVWKIKSYKRKRTILIIVWENVLCGIPRSFLFSFDKYVSRSLGYVYCRPMGWLNVLWGLLWYQIGRKSLDKFLSTLAPPHPHLYIQHCLWHNTWFVTIWLLSAPRIGPGNTQTINTHIPL